MKVLMISTDASVFECGSAFRARALKYGGLFGELYIIVKTKKTKRGNSPETIGGNVHLLPTNNYFNVVFFFSAYAAAARIIKADAGNFIVSSQDEFGGLVAYFLKLRFGVPWQAQVHTDIYSAAYASAHRMRVFIANAILPRASCMRVVSKRVKDGIAARGIVKPTAILPIFVDTEHLHKLAEKRIYEASGRPFNFLMVSRLAAEKDISSALRAMGMLVKKIKGVGLTIVGGGPEIGRLKALAGKLKITGSVKFEGRQNDVARYLERADAYVLTSLFEGYGMSVVEAMASGLPVIMTDVGVAGEILINNESGIIVEPGSVGGLYRAMAAVAGDAGLRKRLGTAAFAKTKNFPNESRYLDLFKKSFEICGTQEKN